MPSFAAAVLSLAIAVAPGPGPSHHAVKDQAKVVEQAAKSAEQAAKEQAKAAEHLAKDQAKAAARAAKQATRAAVPASLLPESVSVPVNLPVAAVPAPVATPAPAPTPAAPTPTAAPAASPSAPAPKPRTTRRPARPRPSARRPATPTRARRAPAPQPAVRPAPAPSAKKPATRRPRRTTVTRSQRGSVGPVTPLARTVVRALEVVPMRIRITLGVLALLGLGLGGAVARQTLRARRLERQGRRLAADVGVLQSALLPPLPGRIGDVRVSAAYRPAAGLAAGGDFYDAFEAPGGRTAVVVGDVAGHGRDVVPLTALVRYSVRAYLDAGLAPRAALQVASAALEPQLDGRLVTVAVALIDTAEGRITYACAGHPPPLIEGFEPVTACSSPPIGAGVPTGRRQTTVGLAPRTLACFVTDGLTDARVGAGRLGHEGLVAELAALGPGARARDLLARVVRRTDSQPDDMAVCLVSPVVGAHTAVERTEELEVGATSLADGCTERFLAACGVDVRAADEVERQARGAIARTGTAVLSVGWTANGPRVKVVPRPPVALPLTDPRLAGVGS